VKLAPEIEHRHTVYFFLRLLRSVRPLKRTVLSHYTLNPLNG